MLPSYLKDLPVSDEVKQRLGDLGIAKPEALLGTIYAARAEFAREYGASVVDKIVLALEITLPASTVQALKAPARDFAFGAQMEEGPAQISPKFDVAERDRLYRRLEELKQIPRLTPEQEDEIEAIQAKIVRMMSR